jgi:hypothetical protein
MSCICFSASWTFIPSAHFTLYCWSFDDGPVEIFMYLRNWSLWHALHSFFLSVAGHWLYLLFIHFIFVGSGWWRGSRSSIPV